MKEIPLTQGQIALVDDQDYRRLTHYRWYAHWNPESRTFYAVNNRGHHMVSMHRMILDAQPGQEVDHVNHNGLDNRRSNIRLCTGTQNQGNARKRVGSLSSQYKGVSWESSRHKWRAHLRINGKSKHLGRFINEKEAARAYDEAASQRFGQFARLNFP